MEIQTEEIASSPSRAVRLAHKLIRFGVESVYVEIDGASPEQHGEGGSVHICKAVAELLAFVDTPVRAAVGSASVLAVRAEMPDGTPCDVTVLYPAGASIAKSINRAIRRYVQKAGRA